jgi:hypothetical protein
MPLGDGGVRRPARSTIQSLTSRCSLTSSREFYAEGMAYFFPLLWCKALAEPLWGPS